MKTKKLLLLACSVYCVPVISFSAVNMVNVQPGATANHPFYAGLTIGYGTTTWSGLVASEDDDDIAMAVSTPTSVNEGGTIGGVFVGYEIFPSFAMEFSYTHYPNAKIYFDEMSLITYDYGGITELISQTNNYALVGKFLVPVPHTRSVRVFSSVGPSVTHRQDSVYNHWQLTPTFNFGFDIDVTEHIVAEVGANYTAGTAISEMNPAVDYIPFLYSGFGRLMWRF